MNDEVLFESFPKQQEYVDAVFSGEYSYLMYGGAIKGGKTFICLALLFALCKFFPGSRWAIVREDWGRIRKNVLPIFNKIKPRFVGDVNLSSKEATCANGSKLIFFPESLKTDPDLDRFKGLDVNGFLLEEANELAEDTFWKAIERAGSWIIHGDDGKPKKNQPPPIILLNTNPASNWVLRLFYAPFKKGQLKKPYFYLPASPFDNPYLTEAYLESLKNLPEAIYQRFVAGDWSVLEEPDQLISYQWVKNAVDSPFIDGKRRAGVDVARFGDDESVIAGMKGYTLVDLITIPKNTIPQIVDRTRIYMQGRKIDSDLVGVDVVGMGAGVVDYLHKDHFYVKEIIAGAKPVDIAGMYESFSFYNLRSQMWWHAREMLRLKKCAIRIENYDRLQEDLTAPRYKISSDRMIRVESKEDIKKRIGRSTDHADAFIQALFVEHVQSKIPQIEFI